jgi:hypothetical protein
MDRASNSMSLSFSELAQMRATTRYLLENSSKSLENYRDANSGGFFHVLDQDVLNEEKNTPGDFSKASTATVVSYLNACKSLELVLSDKDRQTLLTGVVKNKPWASAGLTGDNPFTVAFTLELVADLTATGVSTSHAQNQTIQNKITSLKSALSSGGGAISIDAGLPNAFLTQLVVRVLARWDHVNPSLANPSSSPFSPLDEQTRRQVRGWAMATVDTEISLSASGSRELDVFELGYAILLVWMTSPPSPSPLERRRLQTGLQIVFNGQTDDGTWPRSRRLFHYPKYGNAYCFEYEYLTQLMEYVPDQRLLRPFLGNISHALERLAQEYIELPNKHFGWMSGHHRQLKWPESWSTASCLHFTNLADRFLADCIRDCVLDELNGPLSGQQAPPDTSGFDKILDSIVDRDGEKLSLKRTLINSIITPIENQREALELGGRLKDGTPLSAILYGPPGTSKTTYVKAIAGRIGWPLVSVTPSHLLRNGFENLMPEMYRLFRMLELTERSVVFFDEIDELVRDRSGTKVESTSRFLTTAMLPEIMKLRESRRILFFVATNHIEEFDDAIARPGRFDLVLPVLPPSSAEKLNHFKYFGEALTKAGLELTSDLAVEVGHFTYDEMKDLEGSFAKVTSQQEFRALMSEEHPKCSLVKTDNGKPAWKDLIVAQASRVRIPRVNA